MLCMYFNCFLARDCRNIPYKKLLALRERDVDKE